MWDYNLQYNYLEKKTNELNNSIEEETEKVPKVEDIKIDGFNFEKKSNLFPFIFTCC